MSSDPLAAQRDRTGYEAAVSALRAAGEVEVRETHISYVFLAGDSAYKLKKPVKLPFLDYGTREKRRVLCHEEVRLNRRLAPTVYRGVVAIVPHAGGWRLAHADDRRAVEHLVWMRRFDEQTTLAARLDGNDVDAVAATIARFHGAAAAVAHVDPVEQIRRSARETFETITNLAPETLRPAASAGFRATEGFLRSNGDAMRRRARAGHVVDGHGDLRAEHVLVQGPGVEIVDCVEFDPALRRIDAGADLSFLVMDLEHLGAPELGRALVGAYVAHGGDPGPPHHVAFHAAQRAYVRAKAALLRDDEREAAGLMALGRRLTWRARQPLLLVVCGLSATGKTTLAHELAGASGASVLSSDIVRKQLAGVEPGEPASPEHYSREFSRRTYAELGRLAECELRRGGIAIVDATFRRREDRLAFGRRLASDARVVECVVPAETRVSRAARPREGGSDATAEVAIAQTFEPLDEIDPPRHLRIRTDRPMSAVADAVEGWLDAA